MLKLKAKDQLEYYPQGLGYNCDTNSPSCTRTTIGNLIMSSTTWNTS